ncbi:MAG: peptidase, partial [Clostridiales bacterium]|nr:peptidase [Clostridiales bacterium]
METAGYVLLGVIVFLIIVIISNIKVVPQAQEYVIQRMGTYLTTWTTGLHFKIPFIDV